MVKNLKFFRTFWPTLQKSLGRSWRFYTRMCAGLCPTYWTTFGIAERNRNGSCPMRTNETTPNFFQFLTPPPPTPQGPMDPTGGGGTSADIVHTQIIFGVDPCTRRWDIAQKLPKFPIDSHSNENYIFLFFRPPGAANPQKGRRHVSTQATPACKIWRESARGLPRNRWPNKKKHTVKQIPRPSLYERNYIFLFFRANGG